MNKEGPLLLILALELAEKYPENFPKKPGPEWMTDFFDKLADNEAKRRVLPPSRKRRQRRRKA